MLHKTSLQKLLGVVTPDRLGFHDFRRNGVLLPSSDAAALRTGLPLHRGQHRRYNAMVMERMGCIEESWAYRRKSSSEKAYDEAVMCLMLL